MRPTILVAEDERALRRLMRASLEQAGYDVLEVLDGEHVLQVVRRLAAPVDLLLTDVMMPRMRGDVLATRLRSLYPLLRVLYVTGYPGKLAALEFGGQLPYDSVLAKPFTPADLVRRVRAILREGDAVTAAAG